MGRKEDQGVLVVPGAPFNSTQPLDLAPSPHRRKGSERNRPSRVMTEVVANPSSDRSAPRLPGLSGLRLVLALHIYVFHIMQAHHAGLLKFAILDNLPGPISLLLQRGFVSTGMFFQLSGLLLAYAYLDPKGRPRVKDRSFWYGRFIRLYPLYFLSLVLLIPAPALLPITAKPTTSGSLVGMVLTNLTLTQAWFPAYAIAWNAPAWALSAFAMFYLVFPIAARAIREWNYRRLQALLIGMVVLSVVPVFAFLMVNPEGNAWTARSIAVGGFWLNVLRFDPLVWLPQFLTGMVLGRLIRTQVDSNASADSTASRSWLSRGDIAVGAVLLLISGWSDFPYVLLRHGLLAPITLVILTDLARGRGLVAWPNRASACLPCRCPWEFGSP